MSAGNGGSGTGGVTAGSSGSSGTGGVTAGSSGSSGTGGMPAGNPDTGTANSDAGVVPDSGLGLGSSADAGDSGNGPGSQAGGDSGAGTPVGPYANVVAVSASGNPGAYTFNVSVESADVDCSQYADWWEVVAEDGSLIFRRILEHSHTDENGTTDANAPGNTFTRSGGPVAIDADDVVIVRAHMNTGGYNGAVMRGTVAAGFVEAPDIGAQFAADVEDEDPQPTRCLF